MTNHLFFYCVKNDSKNDLFQPDANEILPVPKMTKDDASKQKEFEKQLEKYGIFKSDTHHAKKDTTTQRLIAAKSIRF